MMNHLRGLVNGWATSAGRLDAGHTERATQGRLAALGYTPIPWREHYAVLHGYYEQNNIYARLRRALYDADVWSAAQLNLRGPAHRLVEFYAATLWPGTLADALQLDTENAALPPAIDQLWQWSNWASQKAVYARWLPLFGDTFLKVTTRQNAVGVVERVYLQLLHPADVTDFTTDERGYLTWLRLDVPQADSYCHTEVWDKADGTYRRWEHQQGLDADYTRMGTPTVEISFAQMGVDFIPVVHAKFRDVGDPRGQSALLPLLEKIDEANRKATRLGQLLFRYNKAVWAATAGGTDASGRPLPPPRVNGSTGSTDTLTLGDDSLISLPGAADLKSLIPNVDYDAYLNALNADLREIEQDAPELLYFRPTEGPELSGRAIRFMLAPAIKRVEEARANGEDALIRAQQMALTIGAFYHLPLFTNLGGTFESGAFAHAFAERPVLPISEEEEAATAKVKWETAAIQSALGYSHAALQRTVGGLTEEEIAAMAAERASEQTNVGSALLAQFDRGAGSE